MSRLSSVLFRKSEFKLQALLPDPDPDPDLRVTLRAGTVMMKLAKMSRRKVGRKTYIILQLSSSNPHLPVTTDRLDVTGRQVQLWNTACSGLVRLQPAKHGEKYSRPVVTSHTGS